MLQHEFEQRVGIEVSTSEFKSIMMVCKNCDLSEEEYLKVWMDINRQRIYETQKKKAQKRIDSFLVVYDGGTYFRAESFYEEDIVDHFGYPVAREILRKAEKLGIGRHDSIDIKGYGQVCIWWMEFGEEVIAMNKEEFEKMYA